MNFCIYSNSGNAEINLNIINNAYVSTVIETCNGICLETKITQRWSDLNQYQEGYGFLAPKQELLNLISGYSLLTGVTPLSV